MNHADAMIKCLPADVQSKIRSGVAVSSLQQCVEELLLNSVDAGSTSIGVRMDTAAFKVQVVDNGSGMDAEDLRRAGHRYWTSKCASVEDLDALGSYGFRGEALASVVSLATLVEISSRTKLSVKTHVKVFRNGGGSEVFEAAETSRPSAGTTVTVCNFFHNMPVRRNRTDSVLEAERVRQRVEAVSLMHPCVSFTLKNDATGAMLTHLSKARNTYHRFVQIHGLGRAQHLREISYGRAQFRVSGHLGVEGHYNQSLQFLYVNERLLLKTRLHKLLNGLLRTFNGSVQKHDSPEGQSTTRSPKPKRGQELHAVYIVNIKCCYSEYDICLDPAKTLVEFKDWDGIIICMEQAVKAFLSRENLVADLSQEDSDNASENLLCAKEHSWQSGCQGTQFTTAEGSFNHLVGGMLSSVPVHRKRVLEKSVGHTCVHDEVTSIAGIGEQLEKGGGGETAMESKQNERQASEKSGSGARAHGMGCMRRTDEQDALAGVKFANNREVDAAALPDITQEISLNQIVPHQQSSNRSGHSVEMIRKISLTDPYIHEGLQTQSHNNRPVFCPPVLTKTLQENPGLLKRKLSAVDYVQSSQKVCTDVLTCYNIPPKVPKVTCVNRLSKESASLDRFRRIYGKPVGEKMQFSEASKVPQSQLLPTGDICLPGQDFSDAQKETQNTDIPLSKVIHSDCHSPPNFSMFTKPTSDKTGSGGASLATKLSHLKQQKVVSVQSQHAHFVQSETINSIVDAIQDSNNNYCSPDRTCGGPAAQSPSPKPVTGQDVSQTADWLDHFDEVVGKTVYVNKVTGLSRYEGPALGEAPATCTSDITSMAVNVVSETGQESTGLELSDLMTSMVHLNMIVTHVP